MFGELAGVLSRALGKLESVSKTKKNTKVSAAKSRSMPWEAKRTGEPMQPRAERSAVSRTTSRRAPWCDLDARNVVHVASFLRGMIYDFLSRSRCCTTTKRLGVDFLFHRRRHKWRRHFYETHARCWSWAVHTYVPAVHVERTSLRLQDQMSPRRTEQNDYISH